MRDRAARGFAAAALAVACVVVGPTPQLIHALERVYAVAIDEQRRGLRRDRVPGADRTRPGPRQRHPLPRRP